LIIKIITKSRAKASVIKLVEEPTAAAAAGGGEP
jgi:hypothetical protein